MAIYGSNNTEFSFDLGFDQAELAHFALPLREEVSLMKKWRRKTEVCRNEVDSIHVPQHGLGAPFCRAVACRIILTLYETGNWQTFGRLRLESNQVMQHKRDFSSALVNVYGR